MVTPPIRFEEMSNFKIQMSNECQSPKFKMLDNLNFGIDLAFELWHLTFISKLSITS
jgi:hypothetical protein